MSGVGFDISRDNVEVITYIVGTYVGIIPNMVVGARVRG